MRKGQIVVASDGTRYVVMNAGGTLQRAPKKERMSKKERRRMRALSK